MIVDSIQKTCFDKFVSLTSEPFFVLYNVVQYYVLQVDLIDSEVCGNVIFFNYFIYLLFLFFYRVGSISFTTWITK